MGNGRKSTLSRKNDVLKRIVLVLSVVVCVLMAYITIGDNIAYH